MFLSSSWQLNHDFCVPVHTYLLSKFPNIVYKLEKRNKKKKAVSLLRLALWHEHREGKQFAKLADNQKLPKDTSLEALKKEMRFSGFVEG